MPQPSHSGIQQTDDFYHDLVEAIDDLFRYPRLGDQLLCREIHFVHIMHSSPKLLVHIVVRTAVSSAAVAGPSLALLCKPAHILKHLLTQALFLTTNGDQLLGRAENGFMWLWDLSAALGWARDGPSAGSWLRDYTRRCPDPVRAACTLSSRALTVTRTAMTCDPRGCAGYVMVWICEAHA